MSKQIINFDNDFDRDEDDGTTPADDPFAELEAAVALIGPDGGTLTETTVRDEDGIVIRTTTINSNISDVDADQLRGEAEVTPTPTTTPTPEIEVPEVETLTVLDSVAESLREENKVALVIQAERANAERQAERQAERDRLELSLIESNETLIPLSRDNNAEDRTFTLPKYYRLGVVLEAISLSLDNDESSKSRIGFKYLTMPDVEKPSDKDKGVDMPIQGKPYDSIYKTSVTDVAVLDENGAPKLDADSNPIFKKVETKYLSEEITIFTSEKILTTFDVPVSIDVVDSYFNDHGSINIFNLIKKIITAASVTLPNFTLDTRVRTFSPDVIEVFVSSKTKDGQKQEISTAAKLNLTTNDTKRISDLEEKIFVFNYGEDNSLIESANVNSKIDPSAWASFRMPSFTGRLGVNLANYIFGKKPDGMNTKPRVKLPNYIVELLSITKNSGIKSGADVISILDGVIPFTAGTNDFYSPQQISFIRTNAKLLRENESSIEGVLTLNKYLNNQQDNDLEKQANTFLGSIATGDRQFYNEMVVDFFNTGGGSVVGALMSNYLLKIDVTIHGTVGISPLDAFYINNFIEGMKGVYLVSNIEESISPGSFSTSLNLVYADSLAEPPNDEEYAGFGYSNGRS